MPETKQETGGERGTHATDRIFYLTFIKRMENGCKK
jgi:hypothetical protein